jgi:DNA-binding protein HU-beta
MTKAELIERVAATKQLPRGLTKKDVGRFIEIVFTEIGDYFIRARMSPSRPARLSYPGFGTFTKRRRNQRAIRNFHSGALLTIPSQSTLTFAPSQSLKRWLNLGPRPRKSRGTPAGPSSA